MVVHTGPRTPVSLIKSIFKRILNGNGLQPISDHLWMSQPSNMVESHSAVNGNEALAEATYKWVLEACHKVKEVTAASRSVNSKRMRSLD